MTTVRRLTSSEAKASLGEVLSTLSTEGPVEITRNGRLVAVLSPPERPTNSNTRPDRLPELAALYAAGKVTWREIAAETGAAFGDLLLELAAQGLKLPRVNPEKTPEQIRLFKAILRKAAGK
jgi:prevent-host-death family protein